MKAIDETKGDFKSAEFGNIARRESSLSSAGFNDGGHC
jgi:hypothetical protein